MEYLKPKGAVTHFSQTAPHIFELTTEDHTILHIHLLAEDILRFRYLPESSDFSYAIHPDFSPQPQAYPWEETEDYFHIHTEVLTCQIEKKDLHISLFDREGHLIQEDEHPLMHPKNGKGVYCTKKIHTHERFFGLGDKAVGPDLRGKRFEFWGTDAYRYQRGDDPLYRNIPFFIGMQESRAYGIFLDNTYRTHFDFGATYPNILRMGAEGGEMNYYFIYGPSLQQVTEKYTLLTGKPELPPLWALGYHQCRYSYYPESRVRDIAEGFRARQIPCDAIYLDIDYMDGFRCFTWHPERFPQPQQLIADLQKNGFKTIVIIDPGIKIDKNYRVYRQGLQNDYFCKRKNGKLFKGKVWPGACHFPDFTHPAVRAWWADLFKELVQEDQVAGIWNDMNEPAVFETDSKTFPLDVQHHYEGHPCDHRKAHNVYGMQMARATYEGFKRWSQGKRPFVISRSGYAGLQRYALVWTGDNTASWDHLRLANQQCQRLSLSGLSFAGSDVGGFIYTPEPELYVRWIQLATFHPFFRTHSIGDHLSGSGELDEGLLKMKNIQTDQEPWSFGEKSTQIIKRFIELRYQLLPYFYTTFWQHTQKGTPMLRPLLMLDEEEPYFCHHDDDFAFGDHILVCPVLDRKAKTKTLYLPEGRWYSYWDHQLVMGRQSFEVPVSLNTMPVYLRAGAVIPHYPVMQYVGEKPIEALTLKIYYSQEAVKSFLYEDEGDGYAYQQEQFSVKEFTVSGNEGSLSIKQEVRGAFRSPYQTYQLNLHGLPFQADKILCDGETLSFQRKKDLVLISLSVDFMELHITTK